MGGGAQRAAFLKANILPAAILVLVLNIHIFFILFSCFPPLQFEGFYYTHTDPTTQIPLVSKTWAELAHLTSAPSFPQHHLAGRVFHLRAQRTPSRGSSAPKVLPKVTFSNRMHTHFCAETQFSLFLQFFFGVISIFCPFVLCLLSVHVSPSFFFGPKSEKFYFHNFHTSVLLTAYIFLIFVLPHLIAPDFSCLQFSFHAMAFTDFHPRSPSLEVKRHAAAILQNCSRVCVLCEPSPHSDSHLRPHKIRVLELFGLRRI